MKEKRLGEVLLEKGYVGAAALEYALKAQTAEKSMIGRILIGHDALRNYELHKAIAERYGLDFVELIGNLPPRGNLDFCHRETYLKHEVLPFAVDEKAVTLAVCSVTKEVENWAFENYPGREVRFVITSPNDIRIALQQLFAEEDSHAARNHLWLKKPLYSARQLFTSFPWKSFVLLSALALGFVFRPHETFVAFLAVMNLFFFAGVIFKSALFALSFTGRSGKDIHAEPGYYPVYTILLPLYREEKTLRQLIASIKKLDYPKSRLDVKFVVEADDNMTIEAIKKLAPPAYMEIIPVPYSLPRTKPKACNYALQYARGEFVTVYDAEDKPDPAQLKKALLKFDEDEKIACVQARLNYYNHNDSQLTRWFALEYGVWFDGVMQGFGRLKMPIPLGGTSNHVRMDTLREVGGWDPFNVTEDADLGMRLAREGYYTATIGSLTEEEAPYRIGAWIKQRRRWMKGFMQTYIVHMRSLRELVSKVGVRGFASLQFFIGLPVAAYLAMPWFMALGAVYKGIYAPWLQNMMAFNLVAASLLHVAMAAITAFRHRDNEGRKTLKRNMVFSSLTFPLYFLLHIIASYLALVQLVFNPHYWDKTEHGKRKKAGAASRGKGYRRQPAGA